MTDDREDKGFKVVDRRSFDSDGSYRDAASDEAAPDQTVEDLPFVDAAVGDDASEPEAIPEIDFVTFVLSLYHSAGCHLGVSPNPETRTCEENLPLAKETIDILEMLQEKTSGNLTGEEERILSEVLFNLRMAYVKAKRG